MFDFHRIAMAVPSLRVADTEYNTEEIKKKIEEADKGKAEIAVFPELAITGYTCADLFFQAELMSGVKKSIRELTAFSKDKETIIIVGAPISMDGQLFNASLTIYKGEILGVNLKTFLPNYNEFYERRWFSSAIDAKSNEINSLSLGLSEEYYIPAGNNVIYNVNNDFIFGIEICEDLWAPVTPGTGMAMSGAELLINLSASNETIGKREYRRNLIRSKSSALMCDYVYVSAGNEESTQDLVFSGHSLIGENGKIISENAKLVDNNYIMLTDIDLGKIKNDRMKGKTFKDSCTSFAPSRDIVEVMINAPSVSRSYGELYSLSPKPFIPANDAKRLSRCNAIFEMQVGGLAKRLQVTGGKLVVGVSGGMDSTLALLVSAQVLKKLGKPMTDLVGITMPAFGTTDRTYNNSLKLMETLGISMKTIPIKDSCIQHYKDIGHDMEIKDITYENVQARERTQVLMDYANKIGAIVVGTGDLSELALGWCTYNADQMSMYGVNASIPKTLVKWMIDSVIENEIFPASTEVLKDIIATPISPELLPPDENGNISQKTEDSVGPYELHDFFLYYTLRFGYTPTKIFYMAVKAFDGKYANEVILKWMKMFFRRFFTQQFKRSCMPDGVKVGSVCLSPRGDWRMPSDASYNLWMKEIEELLASL